jgi:hypothetical protein
MGENLRASIIDALAVQVGTEYDDTAHDTHAISSRQHAAPLVFRDTSASASAVCANDPESVTFTSAQLARISRLLRALQSGQ